MNAILNTLDWSYIRTFVAVAETGSLTSAAKKTGLSQPTVGRHIRAAEAALGAELFTRGADGLALTETGLALLEPAREMAAASARLETLAAGRDTRLSGTVRIAASVVVSQYVLPQIVAGIRAREPEIEIEILPSDASENLIFREADIAIRMYRPEQLDLITRHVHDQPVALYAAPSVFAEHGMPKCEDEVMALPFVGFDRSDLIIRTLRGLGHKVDRSFFGVRCDNQAAYWELVCAGCGVGAMQTVIGDRDRRVERLGFQPDLPALPIWLAAPEALRKSPRIRRVWDLLIEGLSGPAKA
jgi:DNA-binding transcriptional LysR family regulator